MLKSFGFLLLFLCCAALLRAQTQQPAFITDSLEAYILRGIKDWNIPGLAIAIVKDGKVVMSKGYGIRDLNTNAPVDENTLFMIASNSKLFTGTSLAQLDYNKKLSLDDKVTRYIKGFSLYDKNSTELVTIRDMLSHRIGTKTFQGDFTFWNGKGSRREVMAKMRLLKPVGQFRQNFGYCNSCFVTAGEVIPVVSGKPWEVYVYDSLLMPLGMNNTHTLGQGISLRANVAKPYSNQYSGKLYEVPYDRVDNLGAAGSMVSNVKDMARWLIMQADSGRVDGKRIVPWPVLQKTREINTVTRSLKSPMYPTHFAGYGLGVFMNDYNGLQVYYHTGGAFGFVSNTCFVPEERLGIVILTNNDNQNFFEALRYQVLDAYLDVRYVNRSQQQLSFFKRSFLRSVEEVNMQKAKVQGKTPTLPLSMYAGTYENELYGPLTIQKSKNADNLEITFQGHNNLTASLEYMDDGEWLLTYKPLVYGVFATRFKIENNKVVSVLIKANDFVEYDPYLFIKK